MKWEIVFISLLSHHKILYHIRNKTVKINGSYEETAARKKYTLSPANVSRDSM